MADVGFIGLGIMGSPMAGHLIKGGHRVLPAQPRGVPPALTDAGGIACANGNGRRGKIGCRHHDGARHAGCRARCCSASNGVGARPLRGQDRRRHELDLAARDQGVREARSTSWAATTSTRRFRAARSAPRRPSLTIMVGGSEATFAKVKPLFELMGKNITLVGGNGDGQTTQGREPDHRRADDRGGRRGAAVRVEGRRRSRRRCGRR